ncbi:CAZyme family GH16 [Paecilomyces variotii]|nr:CAZyme family GH16 [Paecilomyces variotii]KAJ9292192.1 CAZyme family GH16 [Paecilomyces variotii]KAJ9307360.1 CAZyme family GH16 [Paecilomyces variotii]
MRSTTFLPALAVLAKLSTAAYTLQQDFGVSSFFDNFAFFTGTDPTNGFVDYVDQSTAQSAGLISTGSSVYIGVDNTNVASSSGRQSVRISSTATFNHGLVILDLAHMPGGICGTWPAFWMLGSDWPNNGEIDIIEGVNDQSNNDMTLHTSDGCSITSSGFTGSLVTSNCYVDASGQSTNSGCQIASSSSQSFGTNFNNAGGGVYATEWTSDAISIWFFPRGSIPSDITSGSPDPTSWGTPDANFAGDCDIDSHFNSLQIVFDTTFCGDWAGAVWSSDSTCSALASSCQDYVQNNPTAFKDAYWEINSLNVYQDSSNSISNIISGGLNATIHGHLNATIGAGLNATIGRGLNSTFSGGLNASIPSLKRRSHRNRHMHMHGHH